VSDMAEDSGEHARVRARWSTARAGKAELIGGPGVERERESGRAGGNSSLSGEAGPQGTEGAEHAGEGNRCRQPGPTGQREGESEHAGKGTATDRWCPPVRRRGRAAWLGRSGPAGLLCLFLFPWIFYLLFHFFFSRVSNSNSNQVSNSN
jgi:hypothetical protein